MISSAIHLIFVPDDSGKAVERFDRAPLQARASGIEVRLEAIAPITIEMDTHSGIYAIEGVAAFDLARHRTNAVHGLTASRVFPLILCNDCLTSLGVVAGLARSAAAARAAVSWLDASSIRHRITAAC